VQFFTKNTSLIIPTRNRPTQLINLLNQLKSFKVEFFEILIIDSSNLFNKKILKKKIKYFSVNIYHTRPSTSLQRNHGLIKKNPKTKYVMFLDDDVVFFKDAFYEMNKTIYGCKKKIDIGCFGFNQIQNKDNGNLIERLKCSKIIKFLGIYSSRPGSVLKSGWHTKILNVKKNSYLDWMYTTACIYKSDVVKNLRFDQNLGQYSYLEDLDFSLKLKILKKKIIISHLSKFHHPHEIDRSSFLFGITEVINRYKIVKKYHLNTLFFFISIFLRFLISLFGIFKLNKNLLFRALGNILGVIKCLKI
jgi:glycosyltransferase involved in cell wall biosynthesis